MQGSKSRIPGFGDIHIDYRTHLQKKSNQYLVNCMPTAELQAINSFLQLMLKSTNQSDGKEHDINQSKAWWRLV